jgi:hypothetical protein
MLYAGGKYAQNALFFLRLSLSGTKVKPKRNYKKRGQLSEVTAGPAGFTANIVL